METPTTHESEIFRQLHPQWNPILIIASIAISFLGAFTSTQLMCHARMSIRFLNVFLWCLLGSLIYSFCSVWSLHMVAMLACEFDLKIGVNVPLTGLSAILPVFFSFLALGGELLRDRWHNGRGKKKRRPKKIKAMRTTTLDPLSPTSKGHRSSTQPLLPLHTVDEEDEDEHQGSFEEPAAQTYQPQSYQSATRISESHSWDGRRQEAPRNDGSASFDSSLLPPSPGFPLSPRMVPQDSTPSRPLFHRTPSGRSTRGSAPSLRIASIASLRDDDTSSASSIQTPSDMSTLRRDSTHSGSTSSFGLSSAMGLAYRRGSTTTVNAFVATARNLYNGCTPKNIFKGLLWSIAVTSMHYSGLYSLEIPNGYIVLDLWVVLASAIISWVVCVIGCICMAEMEARLSQQVLFSVISTTGVAAMHWTGMRAVNFWSSAQPSDIRGYPPAIAAAVVLIAFVTCISANGLLAHSATISRNKLAEVIWTRRELWRTIAQKENAEAAALARSEFIASASHEIRTPLHHLQGYSDLLSQTPLTEEGRSHLAAIQRATKTLSLITNNVLDWSKLEKDAKAVCKPVSLDLRTVCESIIVLLPNKDDEADVELCVVVSPDVPSSVFLDETYIHRILMNLLSNALKFTRSGYILLSIETNSEQLTITVKDTGCGLDPSFIPLMWEPYKQGEQRGTQRGTGLGLSIIRQLLQAMNGTIDVDSKFAYSQDVGLGESGSVFTISIPLQPATILPVIQEPRGEPQVAILTEGNSRSLEGIRNSWEKFGYQVTTASDISEFPERDWKYIWADMPFLVSNKAMFRRLMNQDKWLVLVPYETQTSLSELPGIVAAPQFVLLPKPLIWHSFEKRIEAANRRSRSSAVSRTLRFAPMVEVMEDIPQTPSPYEEPQAPEPETSPPRMQTILLVEDNPINQKLAKKMRVAPFCIHKHQLNSLGHQVLVVEDGQYAIEQITKHDAVIDAVFMDQSMPRKDGITATREIRALEQDGTLSKRHPIIALTAVVNPQAQAMFRDAGADDFLAKPLSLDKLRDTLTVHLID